MIVDDTATLDEDSAGIDIDVLANDTDSDGSASPVKSVTQGTSGGTVSINSDGTVNYVPKEGFTGTDTFTYTNVDGKTETVTVTVNPKPELVNSSILVTEPTVDIVPNKTTHTSTSGQPAESSPIKTVVKPLTSSTPTFKNNFLVPEFNPISLAGNVQDQFVSEGSKVYSIGDGEFAHKDSTVSLKFTATQEDGSPLPDFVEFDAKKGEFRMNAALAKESDATSVLVRVLVSDDSNNQLSRTFQIRFNEETTNKDDSKTDIAKNAFDTRDSQFNKSTETETNTRSNNSLANNSNNNSDNDSKIRSIESNNQALQLVGLLENQYVFEGKESYQIPDNAFKHIDPSESLTYLAVLEDGSDLPDFITFDAESRTFIFNADQAQLVGVDSLALKVIVKDSHDNFASAIFEISFIEEEDEDTLKAKPKNDQPIDAINSSIPLDIPLNDDSLSFLLDNDWMKSLTDETQNEPEVIAEDNNQGKYSLNEQIKQASGFGYQQQKTQLIADLESVFEDA